MKKTLILVIGAAVLLSLSITASAVTETDITDDLWKIEYNINDGVYKITTKDIADYPEIDITSVEASLDGTTLTLTMTVDGAIDSSNFASYLIYYGLNSTNAYFAIYTAYTGIATWLATGIEGVQGGLATSTLSEDQKTITMSFEITETDPSYSVWGVTMEYMSQEDATSGNGNFYYDVAPLAYALDYEYTGDIGDDDDDDETGDDDDETGDDDDDETGDDDDDDTTGDDDDDDTGGQDEGEDGNGGTPGFELLAVIAALAIALIILRRRK